MEKLLFRWAAGFCINLISYADFGQNTKEVQTKINKK
jgi:hypothetical protein